MALTALKSDKFEPDRNASKKAADKALEDMEAEADSTMHAGTGEVRVDIDMDMACGRKRVRFGLCLKELMRVV